MTTSDQLFSVLEQNPSDYELMSIIADSLDDEGDSQLAHVLRWSAKHCKHPAVSIDDQWFLYINVREESNFPSHWVESVDRKYGYYCRTIRERLATLIPFIDEVQL